MTSTVLKLARGFHLPLEVVTEATAIVATRGAGKSSTGAVLVEEALAAGVPTVVIDWTGVFWGLRSSADGDGPGLKIYVLGGPHGDVPLEASAGRFIADLVVDSGHSFVLDLSDFTKGQMRRFGADFLERLYERKARARTTLLLLIDEAHEFAPQSPRGGFKGDAARLIAAMEQVVALGRSRGVGAVLITQRTQALNKAVLDLIETLIVMRMLSPRAVAAVRDWIIVKNEDDERGVLASLPELPTGSAWIWSPLRGVLERIMVRRIRTFDSYATPKPGEVRIEPKARRELDLDALGQQMRATVERVKAEDPRALQARVRELERELEINSKSVEPETVEVEVEVAVIPPEIVRGLEPIYEAAARIQADSAAIHAKVDDLRAIIRESRSARSAAPRAPRRRSDSPPAAPSPSRQASAVSPGPVAQQNGKLSRSQQAILQALATLEAVRVPQPGKTQVAFMAAVSPRSSGFEKNLSTLRTAGYLDYPYPGQVALTDDGRRAAPRVDAPATHEQMMERVAGIVGPTRFRIVRELASVYPEMLSREDLADRAEMSVTSSGFEKNLSTLRSFGLIDYPQRGWVVARPVLFLEGS